MVQAFASSTSNQRANTRNGLALFRLRFELRCGRSPGPSRRARSRQTKNAQRVRSNVPRAISSCIFVNSRATTASRSPRISRASLSVAAIRCGAFVKDQRGGKRTKFAQAARGGRLNARAESRQKRIRQSADPKPPAPLIKALAPGTGTTRTPLSIATRASRKPGSLMPGVPASETTATSEPDSSQLSSSAARSRSLCS